MEPMNRRGEIAGLGPIWGCAEFGRPGHDYYKCRACWSAFETHLASTDDHQVQTVHKAQTQRSTE